MKQYQIKRRCVSGSIIWRMWHFAKERQFAVAQFVRHLSRLGVPVIINFSGLQSGKTVQCTAGEFRIDDLKLQRGDDTVATKEAEEPWYPPAGMGSLPPSGTWS